MARIYADIPKFKRVEAALRGVAVGEKGVIAEIDRALSAQRTKGEREVLNRLRDRCSSMLQDCINLLIWFNDELVASKG